MPPIIRGISKQARKVARAAIGPLALALLTPARRKRNLRAATAFLCWSIAALFPLDSCKESLGAAVRAWAGDLWESGDGKDALADTLYGLRMLLGENAFDFSIGWNLHRQWTRLELPRQPPLQASRA
jgi:hypothetical protein